MMAPQATTQGGPVNLAQLRYFKKLAEVEHFTKAAEALYITQPALSNSIKQLERELGIPLFEQTGRNVRLTKWGQEFCDHITAGLHAIDKGTQIAQEHASSLSGSIDIGTIFTVQAGFLPRLLQRYRERFGTAVDARLYQGLTADLVERLEAGTYDVVFCSQVAGHPAVEFIPITHQDLVAVVHESSPLAGRDEVSLNELGSFPLVTYWPDSSIGEEVHDLVRRTGAPSTVRQHCYDEITLGSVIAADPSFVGLSLDTLGLAPFAQLRTVRLTEAPAGFHPIYLAYVRGRFMTRAVENMIELAREIAEVGGE
ncbi:LysR family transcriptional regulator [Enterorhabdus mucosicola]|uniref:LysR family transcriptional regulator n=1 Tax=Adlercreutzia mucosicola TaxID=580026 RepID=A0A6N8JP36_9ACTN|nr:LysR family transcriptional regulator [Adlercreutzia mucosicola]